MTSQSGTNVDDIAPDLDDIIAQHLDDGNDVGDTGTGISIDDLLNEDLATSVLQSPENTNTNTISTDDATTHLNKPQLSTTLPSPHQPKVDTMSDSNSNAPDLPSAIAKYSAATSNTISTSYRKSFYFTLLYGITNQ